MTQVRSFAAEKDSPEQGGGKKVSELWVRFRDLYKSYWYILVPVHIATSITWFVSAYFVAKTGVNIVPMLEWVHAPDWILDPLRKSDVGYYAIAYAMYKIVTPARYVVTIGRRG